MPIRASTASRGEARTTGRSSTANRPGSRAIPNKARNNSSWPMPCRPAMPRISPGCRANEDCRCASGGGEVFHAQNGRADSGRARRLGRKGLASALPVIMPDQILVRDPSDTGWVATSAVAQHGDAIAEARTSRMRCEMNTMVVPPAFSARDDSPSQSMSRPDSVEVGSSSSRIRGRGKGRARSQSSGARSDRDREFPRMDRCRRGRAHRVMRHRRSPCAAATGPADRSADRATACCLAL